MALVLVAQPVSYARLTPALCMFDAGILNTAHHHRDELFLLSGPISTVPIAHVEMQFVQYLSRAEIEPIDILGGETWRSCGSSYAYVCFAV
jgi:hypothetical protein